MTGLRIAAVLTLTCVGGVSVFATDKLPAPTEAEQEPVRVRIRELWKADYARTDARSMLSLADTLMAQAKAGDADTATRYVLRVESVALATRGCDFEKAVQALRAADAEFAAPDLAELFAVALAERVRRPESLADFRALAAQELAAPTAAGDRIALAKRWTGVCDKASAEPRVAAARRVRRWLCEPPDLDARDRSEIEAMLRSANEEIDKSDARTFRFTLFEGRWLVAYADGAVAEYEIGPDGSVACDAADAPDGSPLVLKDRRLSKLARRGDAVVAPRAAGKQVQRLWLHGDVLMVEPFDASAKAPDAWTGRNRGLRDRLPAGAGIAFFRATSALRAGKPAAASTALDAATKAAPDDPEVRRRRAALAVDVKVLGFALRTKGQQVGDGECWTFVDQALKEAGAARPDTYVFGRALSQEEDVLGGDVVQFEGATLGGGRGVVSFPHHSAIVELTLGGRRVRLVHQNFGAAGRIVSNVDVDLGDLKGGSFTVFRPHP